SRRPLSVKGMSVVPVCRPFRLHSVSPCRIANTLTTLTGQKSSHFSTHRDDFHRMAERILRISSLGKWDQGPIGSRPPSAYAPRGWKETGRRPRSEFTCKVSSISCKRKARHVMSSSSAAHLARSHDLSAKVARVLHTRVKLAQERFAERVQKAFAEHVAGLFAKPTTPWDAWMGWSRYAVDLAQRWVLFWDTLRQRGNAFVEHTREGLPPVLRFAYETVLDARTFARPVNYALVRITPPAGVTVDPKRRPYIIIDPRAGHGPGIGGFKDDSQVGVALAAGHPVYFVIFF